VGTLGAVDAITVDGLRKRYGEVQALDGVTFAVREGEVFGLLGPNGAGKSTTVRVLVTLTRPDDGRASVMGHDVLDDATRVRRTIGYVPQDSGVDTYGTGRENLMLQGHVQGMGGRDLRNRVQELLELVGIADAADRVVRGYSGGMRRRLDIAMSLVGDAPVIFFDEPTTGLDPQSRTDMWLTVRRLVEHGRTVLLTTQYLDEADHLADEIAILHDGTIVAHGTPDELKATIPIGVVELEFGDHEQLVAAQRALGEHYEVGRVDSKLVVATTGSVADMADLFIRLNDSRIEPTGFSRQLPTLDDVFFKILDEHKEVHHASAR
jgi:ABC-2 type transport system ATP-binding protein